MLKVTSPLIIPIQEFDTFQNYFLSLSKKCRNSLTLPKQKRLMDGLQYQQIGWNEEFIKHFMNLWETQNIHYGTPKWPDGWFEFMKELNDRNNFDMFAMSENNEVISVHFIFKFNDYIYCNSPLYDKEKYDRISLGRLMWYNLIRFSIERKYCNFLDLEGNNNGDTFREVIQNKVPPGTPGDFGYKWFFIPEKIKELDSEYNMYYDYKTVVINDGTWKGLSLDPSEWESHLKSIPKVLNITNRKFSKPHPKVYKNLFKKDSFVVDIDSEKITIRNNQEIKVIDKAISLNDETEKIITDRLEWVEKPSISFMSLVKRNKIKKIDYMKVDCRGGEWSLFNSKDTTNAKWIVKNVNTLSIVFNNINLDKRKLEYSDGELNYWTMINTPGNWEVFKDVYFSYFRENGFEITTTDIKGNEIQDLQDINDCVVILKKNVKSKHHFYIRYFKRFEELKLLLDQLKSIGIKKNQVTLVTTHFDQGWGYETHEFENSGYQQGDADLIQKSLELSDSSKINHYLNAGVVLYNKRQFKKYLNMTEESKCIIHIAKGNDLMKDSPESSLGCENQDELATGMIISATKRGVDVLKKCYYGNFLGVRYADESVGKDIYIANMQKYISHNGKGKSFFRYSQENPYLFPEDYERGMAPMNIEQYFYLMVWEETNFRLVNFTDNYRGLYFKDDKDKVTQDLLVNRDAGLIRLNKYRKHIFQRMFDTIKEERFYDEMEFHGEEVMKSKCKNLLVVAHMDDEAIFFGNWLFLNGNDTKVIVTCEPSTNEEKQDSFEKVMKYCNVPEYEILEWEESLNGYRDFDRLKNIIKDEVELNEYEQIVTHNAMGEYGHIQHQQLNEIMTECLYEGLVDKFWVYDLNPLGLEYRNQNINPKEEMLSMYPEQEQENTIGIMRRCESTWYDHNKPGKFGSKYVGGGNLIDYEGLRLIENTYDEKLNIGIIREVPGLNKSYTKSFNGNVTNVMDEEDKFEDKYSSFTNDFSKRIFSYLENHNTEWVDVLDEFDDFVGLTNENKQMYVVVTEKSAMVLHKLGLPYIFFANFSENIPNEIKSSASRIVYPGNGFDVNQFNETVVDFTRHHDVIKYDILAQLWRATTMKKRHNTISKENMFSTFQVEDDTNQDTLGRMHLLLKNPDYEGFYFIEGLDIRSGNVVCNWKVNLSTTNMIWMSSDLTKNIMDDGFVLRFWKDPIKVENGDGMHPEPHDHDYLPDWKTKKVKYPDFTLFVPRGYECRAW